MPRKPVTRQANISMEDAERAVAKVIKFEPVIVGDGYRFDPDEILEAAKGQGFTTVCILGETEDGSMWVSGSANAGEIMVLMEKAKHQIVFGDA